MIFVIARNDDDVFPVFSKMFETVTALLPSFKQKKRFKACGNVKRRFNLFLR